MNRRGVIGALTLAVAATALVVATALAESGAPGVTNLAVATPIPGGS